MQVSGNPMFNFTWLEKPKTNKFAFACAIQASMTSILIGYDIGVTGGAMIYIQSNLNLTEVQVGLLAGLVHIYSLMGSAASGRTSDWIGRRYTILITTVMFFVGALLKGFATNYAFLMVARFVAGIGVGYALMIVPVYTAEVSPALSRGFLTSFTEVFINIGILLGYLSNYAFHTLPENLNWRLMLGVEAIPCIFLGFGVLFMPESPRWLIVQGRLGDARKVLLKTSNSKEEAELQFVEIKKAVGIPIDCADNIVAVPKRNKGSGVWKELLRPTPSVRRVIIAAIGIHFCYGESSICIETQEYKKTHFQQASGIEAVVLYSPIIFRSAGIRKKSDLLGATIALQFVKTIFILVATFLLDRAGRRPLLLISVGGMIMSLAGLGFGLTITAHSDTKMMWAIVLNIVMVSTCVAFFSIGKGPITWVYSAEIFPPRLRAQGVSMGVVLNRFVSGIVSITFLLLVAKITIGGTFFLFAGIATVSWVFFYTFLPETQAKTLEEMEVLFDNFSWRASKKTLKNEKSRVELRTNPDQEA